MPGKAKPKSPRTASILPFATPPVEDQPAAAEFFSQVIAEQLGATDVFRIAITSFLDTYNFDMRRLMKCCTHHVLPSGHVIPFCAYNVLYREGHVVLPALREASVGRRAAAVISNSAN